MPTGLFILLESRVFRSAVGFFGVRIQKHRRSRLTKLSHGYFPSRFVAKAIT